MLRYRNITARSFGKCAQFIPYLFFKFNKLRIEVGFHSIAKVLHALGDIRGLVDEILLGLLLHGNVLEHVLSVRDVGMQISGVQRQRLVHVKLEAALIAGGQFSVWRGGER